MKRSLTLVVSGLIFVSFNISQSKLGTLTSFVDGDVRISAKAKIKTLPVFIDGDVRISARP
jgi:hypothetical protein